MIKIGEEDKSFFKVEMCELSLFIKEYRLEVCRLGEDYKLYT